jgi:5-methylcytosine-specific restriction enzyme A
VFNDRRGSSSSQGYGARWRKLRAAFLKVNPLCVGCGRPAVDVDHVRAKRDGGTDDWANLRPYCHACHSARTGRDQPGGAIRKGGAPNS